MNAFAIDVQTSCITNTNKKTTKIWLTNINCACWLNQKNKKNQKTNTKTKTHFVHLDTFRSLVEPHFSSTFFSLPHSFLPCAASANAGGQDVEVDLSTEIIKQHFQVSAMQCCKYFKCSRLAAAILHTATHTHTFIHSTLNYSLLLPTVAAA